MAINNRSEIIFLYDVSYSNPNGDPSDNNRPRQDPFSEQLLVTDVRLKRTIRDYLYTKYRVQKQDPSCDLYVYSDQADPLTLAERLGRLDGKKPTAGEKVKIDAKLSKDQLLKECIDARLFGATITPSSQKPKDKDKGKFAEYEAEGAIHFTGPVQFNMGHSLHSAKVEFVKGTGAFATSIGAGQRTFREEFVAAYGLIAFYGCIDHHKSEFTNLSEDDIDKMLEAIWCGTVGLNTRSKAGQVPRLLIKVDTKNDFLFGRLTRFVRLQHDGKEGNQLRSTDDYVVDIGELVSEIAASNYVEKVSYMKDNQLACNPTSFPEEWQQIDTKGWYE